MIFSFHKGKFKVFRLLRRWNDYSELIQVDKKLNFNTKMISMRSEKSTCRIIQVKKKLTSQVVLSGKNPN